jgi:copper chaperone CopZ
MKELNLALPGITCVSCVSNIKKETDKLDSCEIEISVPLQKAVVNFDESKTTEEQILKSISKAGYKAEVINE